MVAATPTRFFNTSPGGYLYRTKGDNFANTQTPIALPDGIYSSKQRLHPNIINAEIMTTFNEQNVMLKYTTVHTIQSGRSKTFRIGGDTTAEYFIPGSEISGGKYRINEHTITIDDFLISSYFLNGADEAYADFDVRRPMTKAMGDALSLQLDKHLAQMALKAAYSTQPLIPQWDQTGGHVIRYTHDGTTSSAGVYPTAPSKSRDTMFIKAVISALQLLDELKVPQQGRALLVPPSVYYMMIQNPAIMNQTWGGTSNIYSPNVPMLCGIPIVKTTHIPQGSIGASKYRTDGYNPDTGTTNWSSTANDAVNYNAYYNGTSAYDNLLYAGGSNATANATTLASTNAGDMMTMAGRDWAQGGSRSYGMVRDKYSVDATGLTGLIIHQSTLGTLKLQDLTTESEYDVRRQGTLFVAKYAMGHDILNPMGAVALIDVTDVTSANTASGNAGAVYHDFLQSVGAKPVSNTNSQGLIRVYEGNSLTKTYMTNSDSAYIPASTAWGTASSVVPDFANPWTTYTP